MNSKLRVTSIVNTYILNTQLNHKTLSLYLIHYPISNGWNANATYDMAPNPTILSIFIHTNNSNNDCESTQSINNHNHEIKHSMQILFIYITQIIIKTIKVFTELIKLGLAPLQAMVLPHYNNTNLITLRRAY